MNADDLRYLTDHYDEKIAQIKQIGAPLNFIFITDQHNELANSVVPAVKSMRFFSTAVRKFSFWSAAATSATTITPIPPKCARPTAG